MDVVVNEQLSIDIDHISCATGTKLDTAMHVACRHVVQTRGLALEECSPFLDRKSCSRNFNG